MTCNNALERKKEAYQKHLQEAYEMYQTGDYSITKIAAHLGLDRKFLSKMLKENYPDINIRLNGQKLVDSHIFDNIDTEEKAYWLGFLYADGYISDGYINNRVELCIQEDDLPHLENYKKFLKSNHKITIKVIPDGLGGDAFRAVRLTIDNKDLRAGLVKHGCFNNKSLTIEMPTLNDDLMRHFIRGFFDGDGTIYWHSHRKSYRAGFCSGSSKFLEQLKEYLKTKDIELCSIIRDTRSINTHNVSVSQTSLEKFLKYLYEDSTIYLQRKYDKSLAALGQMATKKS